MYLSLQNYYVKCHASFCKSHHHIKISCSPQKISSFLPTVNDYTKEVSFYDYNHEYKGVSLQASFSMLITLLLHVILNFQSTKIMLAFNIFSISNLTTLTYMKCYADWSRRLTNYINQHKLWFFNCLYLCQVIKIAWVINRKSFNFAAKKCDEYPSARISKSKQLNVFKN